MFCTRCGTKNEDNAVFCIICGSYLVKDARLGQPRMTQQPQYQQYTQSQLPIQYNNSQNEKYPANKVGIASMVLGILAILFNFTIDTPANWNYNEYYFWIPFILFVAPLTTLGFIFGFLASKWSKRVAQNNRFAVAGIICSSIAAGLILTHFMFYLTWVF